MYKKDIQYYKFCAYGFLKNLRFFDAFFILFLLSKSINYTQIGLLFALREITTNLLEIPSGLITDSIGRKKTLMSSYAIYISSFTIFYTGNNFYAFAAAIIMYGMADAMRSGTHKALIYKYIELKGWSKYKVDYYGHTRSCSQLGSAISSVLAAVIVFFSGNYASVYLFSIIPYAMGFMLIASYPSYLDTHIKQRDTKSNFRKVWKEFINTIMSIKVLKSITNLAMLEAYHKSIKDYIQPLIKQMALGISIAYIGLKLSDKDKVTFAVGIIYFVIYLLSSAASRYSSKLLKWKSSLKFMSNLLLITGILAGLAAGIFAKLSWDVLAVLSFILIYIIHNLRKPIAVARLNNIFETDIFASGVSSQNQIKTLLTAVFSVLIGWLAQKFSVGQSLIFFSVLTLILSLLTIKETKNN